MRILRLLIIVLSLSYNTLHAQSTIPFAQKSSAAFSKVSVDSLQYIYSENDGLIEEINTFNLFLKNAKHAELVVKSSKQYAIVLLLNDNLNEEEYKIELLGNNILLSGKKSGIFMAS
ncbi:MAG: hypothetical protein IPJ31_01025 [Bacteroidetes bacterium]|nr:hypothetical protein [Bacteroidota bacterium]